MLFVKVDTFSGLVIELYYIRLDCASKRIVALLLSYLTKYDPSLLIFDVIYQTPGHNIDYL